MWKKFWIACLFCSAGVYTGRAGNDTTIIRLRLDSLINTRQNKLGAFKAHQEFVSSSIPVLKKYPSTDLIYFCYYILGIVKVIEGEHEVGKKYIDTCYTLSSQLKQERLKAKTYYLEGIYLKFSGKSDQAIAKWYEALKIFKDIRKEEDELGTMTAIAREYQDIGQSEKAQVLLSEIIKRREGISDEVELNSSYNAMANVLTSLEKLDEAIVFFSKAMRIAEKYKDTVGLAYTFNNRARTYSKLNRLKEAESDWRKSYELFFRTHDAFGIAMVTNNMAYVNNSLGNYQEAIRYANMAVEYCTTHDIQLELQRAHSNLLDSYYALRDFDQLYKQHEILSDLKDAQFSKDIANAIAEAEMKYKTIIQEDSISMLNADRKLNALKLEEERKESYIYKLAMLSVLLLLGAGVIIIWFVQKNRKVHRKAQQQEMVVRATFETEQRERTRIAGDLHDGVGQKLSAAKMFLSFIDNEAGRKAVALLDEAIQDVRTVSHNVYPGDLSKGLVFALQQMMERLGAQQKELKIEIHTEEALEELVLAQQQQLYLYRLVQECLSNAVKHSGATLLGIRLWKEENQLKMEVYDNGKGFDSSALSATRGLGLANMHNRVSLLKGELNIDSGVNKGTRITVSIPL